jgi:hypothetical protein
VTVDKDELLRALKYDRDQYNRGFNDGIMAAADELVRCKDCKYSIRAWECTEKPCLCTRSMYGGNHKPDHFCSYGEKRDE